MSNSQRLLAAAYLALVGGCASGIAEQVPRPVASVEQTGNLAVSPGAEIIARESRLNPQAVDLALLVAQNPDSNQVRDRPYSLSCNASLWSPVKCTYDQEHVYTAEVPGAKISFIDREPYGKRNPDGHDRIVIEGIGSRFLINASLSGLVGDLEDSLEAVQGCDSCSPRWYGSNTYRSNSITTEEAQKINEQVLQDSRRLLRAKIRHKQNR